jgi:dephospho-CoA kinase
MLKIGLTGNIGAGKTAILNEFKKLGVPVYVMDDRLKKLIKEDDVLRKKLIDFLGPNVFDENNEYNRKYVAKVIFNDPIKKADLGLLFFRHLTTDIDSFCKKSIRIASVTHVIIESAVFFEYNIEYFVNLMVGVKADDDIRLARAIARDSDQTKEEIMAKIKNQLPQDEKMAMCDFVIENSGDINIDEIQRLHSLFRKIGVLINPQNNFTINKYRV